MMQFLTYRYNLEVIVLFFYGLLTLSTVQAQGLSQSNASPAQAQVSTSAAGRTTTAALAASLPMSDILKDAKSIPGFFTLYRKNEKVWLEILPSQMGKPFFFSYNISRSVGERGLRVGEMGKLNIVEFIKIGNQVQLIAKNTQFFAIDGTPQAQFVSESFSDSLVGSASIIPQPNSENRSILIEVNSLLFSDIPGYQTRLENSFRMPFALDARNSSFSSINNTSSLTGIEVKAHFSVPKLSAYPLVPSVVPLPPPPTSTPDPRSLFVSFYYNFMPLPEPMPTRLADERVGYFTEHRTDFTTDTKNKPKTHYIKRWRLEKKDPTLAISEPIKPIVFWLDKNIPENYRTTVRDGVLEWNKAFEKAGFKNALIVMQHQENDDFHNMDLRHASIRWYSTVDSDSNVGPSVADLRSGEILDADIVISHGFTRSSRRLAIQELTKYHHHDDFCLNADVAAEELNYSLVLLGGRGLDLDGPEADALAKATLKRTVMHEVGHAIGLRHNFKASALYDLNAIQNPDFTKINGMASSVMDYLPFNLSLKGEKQGEYVMSTLGPYDYWAIEYGYKEFPSDQEEIGLAEILAKSIEKKYQYDTDEDAGYNSFVGIDPLVNRFDLGSDPLAYYKRRVMLSKELWGNLQTKIVKQGESYEEQRRSFLSGFAQVAAVAPLVAKYIGGVDTRRERGGSSKPLFKPVSAAKQREALAVIAQDFFTAESFNFKPEFIARLATDRFERSELQSSLQTSVPNLVANVQKGILDHVYSPAVATRLAEVSLKVNNVHDTLGLADVYDAMQDAIWIEVKTSQETSLIRRNLQREHLRRTTDILVKPASIWPADARSILRENARQLLSQLEKANTNTKLSKITRAHYSDAIDSINASLKASVQRTSP